MGPQLFWNPFLVLLTRLSGNSSVLSLRLSRPINRHLHGYVCIRRKELEPLHKGRSSTINS